MGATGRHLPYGITRSTDVWATRRLGDRRLGDRFLDDHLRDTGWTFRRQQLDVWAPMNICSGKRFSSSESTSKFKDALVSASRWWSVLEPCVPKQLNSDNRLHDPRCAAVLNVTHHFCGLNVSTPVFQTSNCWRPNVQSASPKWSRQKIYRPNVCRPNVLSPKCPYTDHTVLHATRHKWTHPALTPANQAGTRFTYPGAMEGWVDVGSPTAAWPGIEPTTAWSQIRRPNHYATE